MAMANGDDEQAVFQNMYTVFSARMLEIRGEPAPDRLFDSFWHHDPARIVDYLNVLVRYRATDLGKSRALAATLRCFAETIAAVRAAHLKKYDAWRKREQYAFDRMCYLGRLTEPCAEELERECARTADGWYDDKAVDLRREIGLEKATDPLRYLLAAFERAG